MNPIESTPVMEDLCCGSLEHAIVRVPPQRRTSSPLGHDARPHPQPHSLPHPHPLPLPLPHPHRIPGDVSRRNPQDPAPSDAGSPPLARVGAASEPVAALWGTPGADPRTTLLATLVQAEIAAAASGDIDAATISHDAAGKLLDLLPKRDPRIEAARAAHDAVSKLLAVVRKATPPKPMRRKR